MLKRLERLWMERDGCIPEILEGREEDGINGIDWLRWTTEGTLKIVDRKKHIFKLSQVGLSIPSPSLLPSSIFSISG